MGLLNKTLDLAKKATGAVVDTANKKIAEAKQKKEEAERRFIEEFPYKYRYTVRQQDNVSIDIGIWDVLERGSYIIYNADEEPVYIAKGTVMMGKHHFIVTNPEKKVIGKVSKALFNIPLPFVRNRKTCSIKISGQNAFKMGTCVFWGDREYNSSKEGMTIEADEREKEFKVYDKKRKKPIIHIYKVRSDEGFFKDKYFVGFDNEANKILALLMTIGIDTIRFGEN